MPKVGRQGYKGIDVRKKMTHVEAFKQRLRMSFRMASTYERRVPPAMLILMVPCTILLLVLGMWKLIDSWFLVTYGVSTTGVVYEYNDATDCSNPHSSDSYDVFFDTHDNQAIDFERSANGTCSHTYAIGDKVPILYDPANPHNAEVVSFKALWLVPIEVTISGILCCWYTIRSARPHTQKLRQRKWWKW